MHFLRMKYPMPTFGIWSRAGVGAPLSDFNGWGQVLVRRLLYEALPPLCKGRIGGVEPTDRGARGGAVFSVISTSPHPSRSFGYASFGFAQDRQDKQRRGIGRECQRSLNVYRAGVTLIVAMGFVMGGCGGGVQVIRESPDSGVVRYLYKGNDGHLSTSKRTEAFDKIREFCRGPYQVLKEGKTKGRQRVVEGMGGAEVVTEDWWGVRFQCTK